VTLYLHGLGHAHPESEITNRFLEELDIGTDDNWIMERVGIRSRRSVLPLDYIRTTRNRDLRAALEAAETNNAGLASRAARIALERAGIDATRIGMVIAGSSASDSNSAPAEGCNIAATLGLEVPAFDMNSACTSFYLGLHMLSMMMPDKLPDFVLLAAPETLTTTVDYNDRASAVLWGDAAVAAVLSTRHPSNIRVLGTTLASRPSARDKVVVPRGGHFRQEGRTVQMFGIKQMALLLNQLRETLERTDRTFNFVGHQANLRMLESVRDMCHIPPERHFSNVEWYGNTGAASAASVISMNWEKWGPQDDVAVAGVGAGLTWSSYLLRFGGEA
jgi:3-oxoacyl-[acyl-carrier-protein] synthase-3